MNHPITQIIINPGAGPVHGAVTMDSAWANMEKLLADARVAGATFERLPEGDDTDGRFDFRVSLGTTATTVCMPGLPLDRVRFDPAKENCLAFPRVYVDGNSWWWKYAVELIHETLTGEEMGWQP